MRREESGQGWEDGVGRTHLFDLLLQMLQLRVLLIDEVKLGEVALLHWGRAAKGGSREMQTEKQRERHTEGQRKRCFERQHRDKGRETRTERYRQRKGHRNTERVKVKEIAMKSQRDPERPRETEKQRSEGEKTVAVGKDKTRDRRQCERGERNRAEGRFEEGPSGPGMRRGKSKGEREMEKAGDR